MPNPPPDDANGPPREGRPRLDGWDVVKLIFATYRATLPIFAVVVLSLILATWIVTTLFFP